MHLGCGSLRFVRHASTVFISVVLIGLSGASATTLIVKTQKGRIILAADTRRTVRAGTSSRPNIQDDICKLRVFGKYAFGVTGNADYEKGGPYDTLGNWSTFDDAKQTFEEHSDDLLGWGNNWAQLEAQFYYRFYAVAPTRVMELLGPQKADLLQEGLFVGWVNGKPDVVDEKIKLDPEQNPPLIATYLVLDPKEWLLSTNGTTQRLIDGDLKKLAAEKWKKEMKRIPRAERDWRQLEFLIQLTNDYDNGVGKEHDNPGTPAERRDMVRAGSLRDSTRSLGADAGCLAHSRS
jgi:hypothetical protein